MQSSMKSHRQEKIQLASQFGLKEAALKDEIDMKDKIVVNVKKQVKEVATKGLGRAMQSVIDSLLATEVKKGVRFWCYVLFESQQFVAKRGAVLVLRSVLIGTHVVAKSGCRPGAAFCSNSNSS